MKFETKPDGYFHMNPTGIKFTPKEKIMINLPETYSWEPQEDITAYELAQCMPVLITAMRGFPVEHAISQLPESCKRHFREES